MPTISLIIPGASAVPSHLYEQDYADWEALLLGPEAPGSEGRFRSFRMGGTRSDLINRGLSESAGRFSLVLRPSDRLEPGALGALVSAAGRPGVAGAVAGFCFASPIGDLPRGPLAGVHESLPEALTLEHLLRLRPPAALINRSMVGEMGARADVDHGVELEFVLRVAQAGHRLAHEPRAVVRRAMTPLAGVDETLQDLASHIRILADVVSPSELALAAADLVDAVIVLRAHQRAVAERGTAPLATVTRFPSLFAQWWHRCGLLGPSPRHVLEANGGVAEAVSTDPGLIAKRIVSMCPRGRAPILLGLGRNARVIARTLHAMGMPVIGRDDNGRPAWSAEDDIPVEVIPGAAAFDPGATYIMTVLHDEAFLKRLPGEGLGLRIIRWRAMPGLILAEWRSAALDWALRTGVSETKPTPAGVTA